MVEIKTCQGVLDLSLSMVMILHCHQDLLLISLFEDYSFSNLFSHVFYWLLIKYWSCLRTFNLIPHFFDNILWLYPLFVNCNPSFEVSITPVYFCTVQLLFQSHSCVCKILLPIGLSELISYRSTESFCCIQTIGFWVDLPSFSASHKIFRVAK